MGLLQKAVETYDAHAYLAGVEREGHQTLAPISYTDRDAGIEITVDNNGRFCSASLISDRKEAKTIIPVTEESEGRSGKNAFMLAHPLCDKLSYYIASPNYLVPALEKWIASKYSHPMLLPILTYIKAGTIIDDLARSECIKVDEKGNPKKADMIIRWNVVGIGDESGACWKNKNLMASFKSYYYEMIGETRSNLCMISGEEDIITTKHPGLIMGKTKLISTNDDKNFTYLGRFTDSTQAITVSYNASQKAHNALRWLAAEQSAHIIGGRTFICWNPKGKEIPHAAGKFGRRKSTRKPSDYQAELKKTLDGYRNQLPEATDDVVIAGFDAATTGRLSLVYYNELIGSDFLQRLYDWDNHCCWWMFYSEQKSATTDQIIRDSSIQSPFLSNIIESAFGTLRFDKGEWKNIVDDKVMGQQVQRLVSCRIDQAMMPADIERAIVRRVSSPMSFNAPHPIALYFRERTLSTACAVIRKYYYDHYKEDLRMALEKDRADRSYQYGRLLAVLEKVERDTYDREESREPNAIRLQTVFCQHPLHTANNIENQLERAYFPRLDPRSRIFYKQLIGEILDKIHSFPDTEWNKALCDTYLMGYYLQRNELYKFNKAEKAQEE